MKIPTASHELKDLCASCLREECEGRDRYHMNASVCSRHEPVTLEHAKALMVAMDRLRSSPAPAWPSKVPDVAYVRCLDFKIENDGKGAPLYAWVSPEEVARKMGFAVSPAPVVGGVPDLTEADIGTLAGEAINGDEDSSDAEQSFCDGVRRGYALLASRLPALKPGEVVVVDRSVLEEALQALHRSEPYVGNGFDHTKRVNDAKALLTAVLRAQPTPTEKETDHV